MLGAVLVEVDRRSRVRSLALDAIHGARTKAIVHHSVANGEAELLRAGRAHGGSSASAKGPSFSERCRSPDEAVVVEREARPSGRQGRREVSDQLTRYFLEEATRDGLDALTPHRATPRMREHEMTHRAGDSYVEETSFFFQLGVVGERAAMRKDGLFEAGHRHGGKL